jgi:four helix bundle protein
MQSDVGTSCAHAAGVIIKSLEDLQIYRDALEAAEAISALLRREEFRRDFNLRNQLAAASDKVASHISEGYGQQTDRHFAHFLAIARGSCNEIRTHLAIARARDCVSRQEYELAAERYVRIGKRLTRLMQYLQATDRKQRG